MEAIHTCVSSLFWRPYRIRTLCRASAGYSGGGIGDGPHHVGLAVFLRLLAFLPQSRGGRLDAKAPIKGYDAPRKISDAASRLSGPALARRRASKATRVIRPFPVAGSRSRAVRRKTRRGRGVRRCDQAKPFEFGGCRPSSGMHLLDSDARKIRRVLVLEIQARALRRLRSRRLRCLYEGGGQNPCPRLRRLQSTPENFPARFAGSETRRGRDARAWEGPGRRAE